MKAPMRLVETEATPATEPAATSPARLALRSHLTAIDALRDEAAGHRKAIARLEDEIRAPGAIERELAALVAADAAELEAWAAKGTGERPEGQMPARKDAELRLDNAKRRAADAQAAIGSLHTKEHACQARIAELEAGKLDLVRAVVLDEADVIAGRVRQHLEGMLVDILTLSAVDIIVSGNQSRGIRSPFPFDMRARITDSANKINMGGLLSIMQFDLPSLAPSAWPDKLPISTEDQLSLAGRWAEFAFSLFTDPTATVSQ
jgi:hypothetical protein